MPGFVTRRSGYAGWWVAAAVGVVAFSRVAFFNPVLGIFIEPLEVEFGWSRTEIAGALSLGTLIGGIGAPFIGPYIDRWGGRWFMVGGMVAVGILLLMMALVDSLWQFYVLFGAGRAIVTAVLDIAIMVTIANWFIRHRGRATGLLMGGTRLAMSLMPLIVLLFLSIADWRAAFAALGVLVLIISVLPPYLLVRRRPEDMGLSPDGDRPLASERETRSQADPDWTVRQALHTRAFWLLLFGTSQMFFVGGATNISLASHLQDKGLSQATAVSVITVWATVGIAGGLLGGELRQRLSVRVALPIVMMATTVSLSLLIVIENVWMAYVFALWHGLFFGAMLPLNQIVFADYFGRWSIGAIRGVSAPVQWGLNAAGPVTAGLVFDSRGSYDSLFVVFIGLMLFGAALIFMAGKPPSPPGEDPSRRDPADPAPRSEAAPEPVPPGP
jgi:MFS family permease